MLIKKSYFQITLLITILLIVIFSISPISSATYVTTKLPLEKALYDVYDDKLVWSEKINDDNDIYMFNLSTQQKYQITTNSEWQGFPKVFNDKIIWIDERNKNLDNPDNYDIYLYNITTNQEIQITKDPSIQQHHYIYKDFIIWKDWRNRKDSFDNTYDIYMYDLFKDIEIPICTNPCDQKHPKIYDNKIIWLDNRNTFSAINYEFFIYDLSKNQEEHINLNMTLNISERYSGSIYEFIDNKIIWINYEYNENEDRFYYQVFLYDIETYELKQITNDNLLKSCLCAYDNTIIWVEAPYRNSSSNKSEYEIISYDLITDTKTIIGTISPEILNIHSDTNGNLVWSRMGYLEGTNDTERCYEVFYYFWSDDPSDAIDTDLDEIIDIFDFDDDNDGYNDTVEISEGSEPLDPASTPNDYDKDFIPDSIDDDDDNDGYNDTIELKESSDALDSLSTPKDNDKDFIPDSLDIDDDNDGIPDDEDHYPFDEDRWEREINNSDDDMPILTGAVIVIIILVIVVIIKIVRKKK